MYNEELMVKKIMLIPREDMQKFESHYDHHGAFTNFVRSALVAFNELHDETREELIKMAVGQVDLTKPES